MTTDKFNAAISRLLEKGQINHVISVLRSKCDAALPSHPDMSSLIVALDGVENTYEPLRRFLIAGQPDPERDAVIAALKRTLRSIGRRYLFIANEDRLDPMFAEYRMRKARGTSVSSFASDLKKLDFRITMAEETEADTSAFIRKREEIVAAIFHHVWSLPPGFKSELDTVEALLTDEEGAFDLRSQLISALMLALLKFYDPDKFLLLLKSAEGFSEERLAARAMTAIALVIAQWGYAVNDEPEVSEALGRLNDSIITYMRLKEVVMTLIRTRDTDRVSREVSDAFNSTIKHLSPEALERLQRDGLAVDASETGMNPEWEKLMKDHELEEKMQAINDMQLEGMDVMMQTFARLKSFAFFRSVANWFLPFSTTNSVAAPLFEKFSSKGFLTMADATEMCSGDRFSFVLGILQMPEDKRNLLAGNINVSLEAMADHVKDRENVRRRSLFASEALSFARDIYRFAKLYPKNKDFPDPFESPIDFLHLPLMESHFRADDIILSAADFYFDHGYHSLALPLYEVAVDEGEAERHIFEKIGFCWQTAGDFASALEAYSKADLFSTDQEQSSVWLLKKLAFTNKALGNYDRAADFYRRILERNPEDYKSEFHLATVLLRSGHLAECKELVSKIRYVIPDYSPAERLYNRLKAHQAFAEGRTGEAFNLYSLVKGDQPWRAFQQDAVAEFSLLYPDSEAAESLKILLDVGD